MPPVLLQYDSTPAEINRRPITCEQRFIPFTGARFLKGYSHSQSSRTLFDDSSPIVKRYKSRIIDVLFEAKTQGYNAPGIDSLLALIKSFTIVNSHHLEIKSVSPISEGGVIFDMIYLNKYIQIQFDNDQESAFYIKDGENAAESWDLNYNESLAKLKEIVA